MTFLEKRSGQANEVTEKTGAELVMQIHFEAPGG